MTTKKALEIRRQRNRELAAMDAKNRCQTCKIALPLAGVKTYVRLGDPGRYCSEACADQAVQS